MGKEDANKVTIGCNQRHSKYGLGEMSHQAKSQASGGEVWNRGSSLYPQQAGQEGDREVK